MGHLRLAFGLVGALGLAAAGCGGVAASAGSGAGSGGAGSPNGSPSSGAPGSGSPSPSPATPAPNCGAKPTQLISAKELAPPGVQGISSLMDLAVNATDVYAAVTYDKGGAVLRVPIRGGAVTRVAKLDGSETALALSGDYVVVEERQPDEIVRMGLDGSDRTVLYTGSVSGVFSFGTLATDAQNVYFATQHGVERVPLAGGAPALLTTHTGAIARVGSNVVVADDSSEALYSVPAAGGSVSTLAGGLTGQLGPVVACGNAVCWGSEVPVGPSQLGTGTLQKLVPGGMPESIAQGPDFYVLVHLLFDGTAFYGTMMGGDLAPGVLIRLAASAGASAQAGALGAGLAMDGQCLYTGDVTRGVYSVQKSHWNAMP